MENAKHPLNPQQVPLHELTQNVAATKDVEERKTLINNFFAEHSFTPQAGDIMDRRSKDAARGWKKYGYANLFAWKGERFASHTTLIEHYDESTCTIHTIEGNSDQRVRGKSYDLTNLDDLSKVIFIARPSLASGRGEDEKRQILETAGAGADVGETPLVEEITEDTLLEPLNEVNKLLQEHAANHRYVDSKDASTFASGLKKPPKKEE